MTITVDYEPEVDADQETVELDAVNPAETSYYKKLVENDILTILRPLMAKRGYRVRWGDGRLEAQFTQATEGPWHYVKKAHALDCYMWHSVYHEVASQTIGKPFVPSKCLTCFKTVVRPANLAGAFTMVNLQQEFEPWLRMDQQTGWNRFQPVWEEVFEQSRLSDDGDSLIHAAEESVFADFLWLKTRREPGDHLIPRYPAQTARARSK